jgi:A/G-specific adenine glycosylase
VPTPNEQAFNFSNILLNWDKKKNQRKMPWKGEKSPYKIWLSEIILQQTRVQQGLRYYENFVSAFPDIHALAIASDQKIYKLWEGLGYYTRCRNLIQTARYIKSQLNGNFPHNYDEIKQLKGVGPYTAAAIASFAFNEPRAVVDGNVFRVLSRIFGIRKPIDTAAGKKLFNRVAYKLLDKVQPGLYNQAIMDFGATICKPLPECSQCPFNKYCAAFQNKKVLYLPVKSKQTIIRKRWFYYVRFHYRGKLAIRQRVEKDIWRNLFEFLLIESERELNEKEILKQLQKKGWLPRNGLNTKSFSPVFKQQLSHQLIEGRIADLKMRHKPVLMYDAIWVSKEEIKNYAFPKFITQYIQKQEMPAKKIHISM